VRATATIGKVKELERGVELYIKVGKLIDRSVILNLLKAVPTSDLEGLKSICVRTVPHRPTRKRERRWGRIHGQHAGHGDDGTSRVWIYLWGITQSVLGEFGYGHSNLYDSFVEKLATVLYHEVGHHVHSKTAEYKVLDAQLKSLTAKLQRMKKKQIAPSQFPPLNPKMDQYWNIKRQCDALSDEFERLADEYAQNALSKATEMALLNAHPRDIRFFNIIRDKWIESWFKDYYKMKQRGRIQYIGWPTMLGIFDHLRKCKLGGGVKYNLREMFIKIYGRYPEKNELGRFKRFALKYVKPLWYVSERGRKYAYFTEAQMKELKRRFYGRRLRGLPVPRIPRFLEEPSGGFRQLKLDSWLARVTSEPGCVRRIRFQHASMSENCCWKGERGCQVEVGLVAKEGRG
jgi:hypothetical protein